MTKKCKNREIGSKSSFCVAVTLRASWSLYVKNKIDFLLGKTENTSGIPVCNKIRVIGTYLSLSTEKLAVHTYIKHSHTMILVKGIAN